MRSHAALFASILTISTLAQAAPAFFVDRLTVAGQGCSYSTRYPEVDLTSTEIVFRVETTAEKQNAPRIETKSCTMALPIALPRNQRLILETEAEGALDLAAGASGHAQLTVYQSVFRGTPTRLALAAGRTPQQLEDKLPSQVIALGCGANTILNVSGQIHLLDGRGVSRGALSEVKLKYRLERCSL